MIKNLMKKFALVGAISTLVVSFVSAATIPTTLSRGASLTTFNYYSSGASQNNWSLSTTSSGGVTASKDSYGGQGGTQQNRTYKICNVKFTASDTATANGTAFSVYRNGATSGTNGKVNQYNITAVEPLRIRKDADAIRAVTYTSGTGRCGTSDTGVLTVSTSGTNSRQINVTGIKVGDAICWATNTTATAGYYAYRVYVYEEGTTADQEVATGGTLVLDFASQVAGVWGAKSSATTKATVALSSTQSTRNVTATITPNAAGDAMITVSNMYYQTTFKVTVVAPLDPPESKSVFAGDAVTVATSVAIDNSKTQVSPSGLVGVSADGTTVTITGANEGTGTVRLYDSGNRLVKLVNLTVKRAPTVINLAVGDVAKLNYDVAGGSQTGNYCQYDVADDNGTAVAATVAGQGASTGTSTSRRYRSCLLTLTANQAGEALVTLQKRTGTSGAYDEYDYIRVVVSEAREALINDETTTLICRCSGLSAGQGNASWTSATYNPANSATATYSSSSAAQTTVTVTGRTEGGSTVTVKNTAGQSTTYYKGAEYACKFTFTDVRPLDGKGEVDVGQGRQATYMTEHEMTRYDITSGSCLESVGVSGTTITVKAKPDTVGQTAVVKFYDGSGTLIKILTVHVTEAPDVIHFKGRDIEYQNAVVDDKSIPGELLLTFTDAAKAGRLIIPEDATAQILVVGGGAGGVSTYWKTSDMYNGYAGNGGAGGRVLEITAADNYTLPSGDYTITVGAGGVAVTDVPVKTTPYFYGDNPGGDSSFVGDGIELTAKGGVASPSNEQKPLQFIDVQEQPAIESGIKRDYREASFDGTKDYQAHNGTGAHGDRTGVTPGGDPDYDKTGYTSSITGSEQVYGVGGAGGWVVGNSDDWYTQVPGDDGAPGTGNGGGGASNGGDSGAGGCGCVIVRLAYKEIPQAATLSASPIVAGDALSASVISFTMVDDVPGTWAWIAPETVPATSGEQEARFTPADQQSYSLLDTTIPVTVLTPQEPTETVIATGSLDAESTTETTAELWNYVISSGAEFIDTPALVVNGDGTATLTVGGAVQGTAYVDLYTGSETAGTGTFCRRVIVAVLPDAPVSEDLSVEENESVTSTARASGAWTYAVQVGGTLISVESFDPANGQLTLDGLKAGTAIVDLFKSGELAVRVTVAVKGPTEGYESRVVGEGRSIDVKTTATIAKAVAKPAEQSALTVTEVGTTTKIRGDARGETVIVKLYDEADTLVRVVTVMTTESPHTYVWNGQTITYLGSGEPTNENNTNLVFTFTSTDGILELPEKAIADVLVVGGGGSGVAGNRDTGKGSSYYYRGNGGGGGKANEEDGVTLEVGVYTVCAGAGGAETVKPTTESGSSTRGQAGNAGRESSIAGGSFSLTAEGGAAGSGIASVYDGQTPEAGRFGANYTTSISGASVTYGQNGEGAANTQGQAGAAGADGTGNGGQGGYYANGGKGGNGVVIVRLKGFVETPILAEPIVGTPKLNLGQPLSAITGWTGSFTNSAGKTVAGTFAWVTEATTVPTLAQGGLPVFEVVFTPDDTVFYRPAQYPAAIEFNIVPIARPTAKTGLTYNGEGQSGVEANAGYTLSGTVVATNAGDYVTIVTLKDGFSWKDATFDPTNIAWSIAKAQLGVTAVSTNKLVGAADPEFTATVTGLCGTDVFTGYSVGRTNTSEEVGTYDLIADGPAELNNYTVSYTNGLFEIRRGQITVIVNGQTKGFDDVDAAFDALADGGLATFNAVTEYDITEYAHVTIRKASTLVVGEDGSWTFSGERGTSIEISEIPAEMNLTVDGTLCLFGDVFIGGIGADDTVVDVTTLLLDGEDIVVGQEDDGVDTTDAKAILAFESLVCQKPTKLVLTENGVVRSATQLTVADVFTEPPDDLHKILETPIEGGYEYTLIRLDVIDFPTVHEGLVYTGSEQRGVEDGSGYTLSGDAVATNAGTYFVTATLDDAERSVWEDLTTAPTNITWTIVQRTTTIGRMPGATDLYTGQTLKDSELTNGLASVEGEFVWADASVEPTNGLPYAVIFLPEDLVNNTTVTVEVTVVVHPQVAVPTAEKLTYNGGAQTGVVERTGYTLTGNVATNAGSYEAWATLAPGYVWMDRTDHRTNIIWSIAKAQLGVTAVSTNKLFGAADPKPFMATVTGLCGTDAFTDYEVGRTNTSEVVGTYDLVFLKGAAELDNYTVSYTNGLFEIRRGKVTVDDTDYDDLDAAFAALKDGSKMTFNTDVVHGGYGFPKAATLEAANGTWAITGNLGVSNETAVATNLIVSGKLTLGAGLTVGSDDAEATLKFAELEQLEDNRLTLTTNGTVRSTKQLEIADAFTAAEDLRRILETRDEDAGEWVYTLIVLTPIDVPTAVPGLVYDGGAKTGVVEDTGFTLAGNVATNAGGYTATATLVDPVRTVWIDRTDDPTNIAWTIAKAAPEIKTAPVHTELYDNDRLTNSVLKGEASVPGAFVWAEDDTTVPTNGQVCAVLFKPEDATNYEEVPMTVTVTVLHLATVPTAVPGLVYNGHAQTGVVEDVGFTLTGNVATNAGDYTAIATLDAGWVWKDDHATHATNIAWSIDRAWATVAAVPTDKLVGADDPRFTVTVTGTLGADTVTNAIGRTNADVETVGVYTGVIVPTGAAVQGNYTVTYTPADFEIRAGQVTITVDGKTTGYDDIDAAITEFETHGGTAVLHCDLGGRRITLPENGIVQSGKQLTIEDAFTAPEQYFRITETELTPGELWEYALTELTPVEVPTAVDGLEYNGNAQTGVVEDVGFTLTGNVATNVGTYEAWATLTDGYCWPDDTTHQTNIAWAIGLRHATVTAVSTNKFVGTEEPVFTTEVEGFVNSDDVELTWTVWRTNLSEEVGTYDLIVSGKVQQASYVITYVNGTFEIKAGRMTVTTNDVTRGYDDFDAALAAMTAAHGGTAYFNEDVTVGGSTFAKGSTLTVNPDGSWSTDGTLTLDDDLYVPCEVTASNVVLEADITVGVWTGETATAEQAILSFEEIDIDDFRLTLTTNGVIRSMSVEPLVDTNDLTSVTNVFDVPPAYEIVEKKIAGGYEYTLRMIGYILTFDSKGGSAVDPIVAVCGAEVEKPEDPTKTGYGFDCWTTNDVGVAWPLTMPAEDLTLTAKWTANKYRVAYDPNGGEGEAATSNATYDIEFTVANNPGFAKTGYSFGGWTTNLSSAVRFQPGDSVSNLTAEADATVTMYATWMPNNYKVEYNPNGGTGDPATSNATYDAEFTVAGQPFVKEGYTFESWTNAEGAVFAIGGKATNLTATAGATVKLYAAWEPNGYTLTYKPGEGTGDDLVSNMVYDVWYEVADCTFAKTGYSFREWANEVGTAYQPGDPIRNLTDEPDGNVDFTAVWTANVYTVTYDANNGTGMSATSNATYDVEFAIAGNPGFAKTGYSFNSWTNAEGEVFAFDAKAKNLVGSGNATLYAKWTPNAYTVKYDPNGGDGEAATSNATYDVEFAIAGNPGFTKTGYTFESWTNAEGEVFAIGAPAKNLSTGEAVTLYAAWTPNAYTLTYLSGTDEKAVSNMIYDVEYRVADCMFERTGYTFMTWADADGTPYVPGFSTVKNLTDEPNGNVDFTAQWEENQYTLIYAPGAGATGTPVTNDLDYTETHTVIDNPGFERPYHEFGGWTNLAANTGYEVGETVSQLTGEPDGEVVFTPAWIALSIPVAIDPPAGAGYAFTVSNLTDGVEITKEDGKYPLPIGTKVGIYSVAKPGYEVRGEPLVIDPVTEDVADVIAKAKLPTAEKVVFVDADGTMTKYTGRKDTVTIPSEVDGVTITGVADGVFDGIGSKDDPSVLNLPEGWEGMPKGLGEGPFEWKDGIFTRTVTGDADDPWRLDDVMAGGEEIAAWTNETGALVVVPTNADISVAALANVVGKLGEPPALLTVAEEEEEVPVKSIIDEDGNVYRTLDDLFEAEPLPETVRLYVVHEYTLTYKPGEGEGEDVETNLVYDVEHTVIGKPDDFAKTGYSFKEWTNEDGKVYLPGEIVSNLTSVVDGNVDFTAVWTANVYQVTYDANGGTGEPAASNETYDVAFTIAGNPGFAKTGYSFGSWTNAAGEVFAIGAPAKNLSTGEAVTLYAAWTPNTYRLVCTAGEGTGTPVTNACTYDVEYTVPGKPDGFAEEGCSFANWTNEVDHLGYLPGETFSNLTDELNAVVTWTAVWTANVYTVTFDPNGGTGAFAPIVAKYGEDISGKAPADPEKDWYAFAGWFDGDVRFVFTTMPAGGAALTAHWDPKQGAPENPWNIGPNGSDAMRAYFDPKLGTVVLEPNGTNELDLVALTNELTKAGVTVDPENFNATVKTGADEFMTPAGWLDAKDPTEFAKTLGEALEDDMASVLLCEDEPPAKIIEKAETETGDTVTATVENDPGNVPNAIQASAVGGLIEIAKDKKEDVRLSVEAKTEADVDSGKVEKLLSVVTSIEGLAGYHANYVDLSVFIGERQVDELDKAIDIYIPWTFDSRYSGYKMSCIHGDSVEEIPFGAPVSGGSEYFEKAADGRGFILHMSKFCDCLLAEIEASSSITTVMDDGTVIEIDVSKGIYDFKPPTKQGYLLSLTGNDGQPVVAGAPVRSGVVSVTAEWVRRVLWEKSEGVIIDNPYNVTAASVWDGYVVDAAGLTRGTIQLKVAKPNKKTGISKVTATVLLTGEKKVSIKGETADGRMTVTDKTGRVLDIVLSESAVAGTYGGMEIDGSRNMFTAKDAVSKSRADDAYARWQGVYVVVLEDADGCYGGVTLTVAKKGKIKVSGALADGTKVSGNTQLLIGERSCACAFSYTKKDVSTSFLVWFCTDGTIEISNLSEGGQGAAIARHATGAALEANAVCQISAESIVSAFGGGVNTEVLPNGTPVWQEGTKWKVAKAGKVAYKNGAWTYTGDNLAGVKLTYTAKTAIFKGSFTVYNLVNGKLKKVKVTVNGVMLDGKGYGTATVKKPVFKCPITIGKE